MARIELDAIRKAWGDVVAVEHMDLVIDDGEFVSVLGPSGCGKSTTLFMLAGIYAPTGGSLRFDSMVVNEVEAKDRNVGIVFQSYALYPHMTVQQNIMFPLKFKQMSQSDARERAERAAALVHVEDLLDRRPNQMSGGQQQRVALARALVKEPDLLLLDEPLSNLDATLRLSMRTEIKKLQRQLGVTTVLVTHDQIEATTMADRIVCMSKGKIEQVGSPHDLYSAPASLFVASFIGAPPINLLEGTARDGSIEINGQVLGLQGSAGGSVTVGIRPEDLHFDAAGMPGKIDQIEPMGRETLYIIDTPIGAVRLLSATADQHHPIGAEARVSYKPESTLVFDRATERLLPDVRIGPATAVAA